MKYRHNQFDNKKSKNVKKSLFDLSHEFKTQMCFGRYYPVLLEECYPGDEWHMDFELEARFPGLYFPVHQIATYRADIFYCPSKLLFPGGNEEGAYTINYQKRGWVGFMMGENVTLPTMDLNINGSGGDGVETPYSGCSYPIENYMGFPMDKTSRIDADRKWWIEGNAMPLAMYLFCYDEYYRNPQWEEPQFFPLQSGHNNEDNFDDVEQRIDGILYTAWEKQGVSNKIVQHPPFFAHYEKDYFTTARPEPQEGESVQIPVFEMPEDFPTDKRHNIINPETGEAFSNGGLSTTSGKLSNDAGAPALLDTQETAPSILKLRYYQVLQQFKETAMRAGKRWRDWVKTFFGNDPEPNAIDIPQLCGSWFGRIQISDTLTTADTSDANTGNYRGNMNASHNGSKHHYYCQDYGYLMVIINFMPNTGYMQGIHPMWTREVREDFPLDMFSGIGDQEIKRKELHVINVKNTWDNTDEPNEVIGYQDRFAEAKTRVNRVFNTQDIYSSFYMGQILDNVEENYKEINCGRIIIGASYLINNGIREADIFNIQPIKEAGSTYVDATIYAHMYFDFKVERCLPYFSTPGKQIF